MMWLRENLWRFSLVLFVFAAIYIPLLWSPIPKNALLIIAGSAAVFGSHILFLVDKISSDGAVRKFATYVVPPAIIVAGSAAAIFVGSPY